MTTQPLNEADLDALRKITSPTVCNAIETLDLRPRSEGFMGPEINCIFPDLGPFVAYACTAIISARMPDRIEEFRGFWLPGPASESTSYQRIQTKLIKIGLQNSISAMGSTKIDRMDISLKSIILTP